ncbi:MAG: DNA-binding protein [Clostridia bacterium]|nr:DNA-binding protein [Clostridia bacterium]
MFEKDMKVALLLDFYGDVLSERHRDMMELYYADDLSLAEIAESEGISRQGVRHILKTAEDHLRFLEERLGLAAQFEELKKTAEEMETLAAELATLEDHTRAATLSVRMRRCAAELLSKPTEQEESRVPEFDRETDGGVETLS